MDGADHPIEAIEIPYRGKSLAAYLHLPNGHTRDPLPCLVMIEGMDAFKELAIFGAGDRFLRRGFACLAVDWLNGRGDIDSQRSMAWGLSFGSFWATQMAAAEPRFAACAVMYTCFQPHNWPLFEMAAPSFKQRFMYMTGIGQEEEFGAVMQRMDVRSLSGRLQMPYFVMAGEDDSLSDLGCTIEHLNAVTAPKTLVVYAGEEHGMGSSRSSQLGTPFFTIIADWLLDRAAGKTLISTYNLVDRTGQMHSEPWATARSYQYGAPLGTEQLFSGKPPIGVS